MKRPSDYLLASAGFLVLVLALAHTASGRAIAQEFVRIVGDVRITNTLDSPIPTKINEPVPVASSPHDPVLTKATLLVIDTFQKQVTINLPVGQLLGTASFVVPGAKLLRIESVSGFAQTGPVSLPGGINDPFVTYSTTANGNPGAHFVFEEWAGNGWFLSPGYSGTLAYADPDSTVNVLFQRKSAIGPGTMTLTFTGHFMDQ
jgi:hypothetical protein